MGGHWGWGSSAVLVPLAVSVILFAAWVLVESRSRVPVIDMRMMRLRSVWTTNLVALLFGASMYGIYAYLPIFLQTPAVAGYGFAASVTEAGWLLLPALAGMAVGGMLSGPIAPVVGFRAQLGWGSGLIAVSCAGYAFLHTGLWEIAVTGGIFGLGLGFAYAAMSSVIVQNVDASQTGAATGMNANIRTIGGAIGTAVTASIVAGHVGPAGLPVEAGYTTAFAVMGVAAVVAVAVSLAVPRPRPAMVTPATVEVAEPVATG